MGKGHGRAWGGKGAGKGLAGRKGEGRGLEWEGERGGPGAVAKVVS